MAVVVNSGPRVLCIAACVNVNYRVSLVLCFLTAVVVVVDVSRIWNRSRLDSEILKLLHVHSHTPTVLVLNKVSSPRAE